MSHYDPHAQGWQQQHLNRRELSHRIQVGHNQTFLFCVPPRTFYLALFVFCQHLPKDTSHPQRATRAPSQRNMDYNHNSNQRPVYFRAFSRYPRLRATRNVGTQPFHHFLNQSTTKKPTETTSSFPPKKNQWTWPTTRKRTHLGSTATAQAISSTKQSQTNLPKNSSSRGTIAFSFA